MGEYVVKQQLTAIGVFCGLVALAAASRLIFKDWIANFHAVTAVALFAGFYFRHWVVALAVPLTAMVISDLGIPHYDAEVRGAVYLGLVLPLVFRPLLRSKLTPVRVGASSIGSSALFFLVSNLAVWHSWRPHTFAELMSCYAGAVPFFRTSVCGDLLFAIALFGSYALLTQPSTALENTELDPMSAAA